MICGYCKGSRLPGIHLPADFDDREESRDGMVWVARCDECFCYADDSHAAHVVAAATGWLVHRSYDRVDSLDEKSREKAKDQLWHRCYFAVTLRSVADFMSGTWDRRAK